MGQKAQQSLSGISDPGPIFDFDGDGKVSPAEAYAYENWLRDSGLLERSLQEAPRYSDGTLDLASFLRTLPTPSIGTKALQGGNCDQGWVCCFIRGGVNRDWSVDIGDNIALLGYLSGGAPPPNMDAADVNDDGRVNYADPPYLLSYLFSGGPPPPAPFPSAGIDPTYDPIELPCQDSGDFEHAPNPLEKSSVAVPPNEVPHDVRGFLPSNLFEPVDGTGALGSIAPELEAFPGPGGLRWGVFPSYRARYVDRGEQSCAFAFESELGANWFSGIPHVVDAGPNASPRFWVRWSASWVRAYSGPAGGPYLGRFDNDTKLVEVVEGNEQYLVLYDLAGRKYVFFGYGSESRGAKGRLARIEAPAGAEVVLNWLKDYSKLESVEVKFAGVVSQSWDYEYGSEPANLDRIIRVSLSRTGDDGNEYPYEVRFRYFGDTYSGEEGGSGGDLMQIDVTKSLSPLSGYDNTITRSYYFRYYKGPFTGEGEEAGYAHQVRYVFKPDTCSQFDTGGNNPYWQDNDVGSKADLEFSYCADRRPRTVNVKKRSCCGVDSGGVFEFTWYSGKPQWVEDPDAVHMLVAASEPVCPSYPQADSVRTLLAYNVYGQIVCRTKEVTSGGQTLRWTYYAVYTDGAGNDWYLADVWWPDAVEQVEFNESGPAGCFNICPGFSEEQELLSVSIGQTGRHRTLLYSWSGPDLSVEERYGEGQAGTTYPTYSSFYKAYFDGLEANRVLYALKWRRRFYGTGSSSYAQTDYSYQFYTYQTGETSLAVKEVQEQKAAIPTGHNGSGERVVRYTWYEEFGAPSWRKDGRGAVHFVQYHPVTFQVKAEVTDIDTASPPPGVDIGGGPPDPKYESSGGERVNAAVIYSYDGLGRRIVVEQEATLADDNNTNLRRYSRLVYTKLTGPSGKLSADNYVVLYYPHVEAVQGQSQEEWLKLGELSISIATPGGDPLVEAGGYPVSGGSTESEFWADDWDPSASDLLSAFRPQGKLFERSEKEYDPDTGRLIAEKVWLNVYGGQAGVDYFERVRYFYDSCGRLVRTVGAETNSGLAQITRTGLDPLGRVFENWSGTDDVWDPANAADPPAGDMVLVSRSFYDGAAPTDALPLKVGNGLITLTERFLGDSQEPGGGTCMRTRYLYDFIGRQTEVQEAYDFNSGYSVRITTYQYRTPVVGDVIRVKKYRTENGQRVLVGYTYNALDEFGRVYRQYDYGVKDGSTYAPEKTSYWYDEEGAVIKIKNQNSTFEKTVYDGAGRLQARYLSYDLAEPDSDYQAAKGVAGDTVIEQTSYSYDKAGNETLSVSFERLPGAEGEGQLSTSNGRPRSTARWYDRLGRAEVACDFGAVVKTSRPSTRPGASNGTERTTRYVYGDSLIEGRRWEYSEAEDNTISGSEIDTLGRTVLSWKKSADSGDYRVKTLQYDALGHVVRETVYQDREALVKAGFEFGQSPPHWTEAELLAAWPCSTEYVWGVVREEWTGAGDWSSNLISSTGMLREVRPPDGESGDPGGSDNWRRRYAYDAFGRVRAQWLDVTKPGESTTRIGRAVSYDALGRKVRDEVKEGYDSGDDPARACVWNYDVLGRVVWAKTLSSDGACLNNVTYEYDPYGSVTNVTEDHDGDGEGQPRSISYQYEGPGYKNNHSIAHRPVEITGSFPVTWSYGEGGGVSDMLGRVEECSWRHGLSYRGREEFVGKRTWLRTTQSREYDFGQGPELHDVFLQERALDTFGRPGSYQALQLFDPAAGHDGPYFSFNRSYTYGVSTGFLTQTHDEPSSDPNYWGVQVVTRTLNRNGFGEVDSYSYQSEGLSLERSWGRDGVGNWQCYSGDFPQWGIDCGEGGHTRCYNRRQEIEAFTEGDCDGASGEMEYDEAGRIVRCDHSEHGVGDLTLSYDAWGRLLSITEAVAGTVRYRRDALGRLIEREGPGEACGVWENHYYYGNEALPVFSEAGGGGSQVAYVRSPATGRLLEVYTESEGPSWCVVDGRGEITGLIAFDESGTPYHFCWYDSEGSVEEEQVDGYPPCSGLWGGGWIWEEQFDLVLFTANSSFYFEQISDPPPFRPAPERIGKLHLYVAPALNQRDMVGGKCRLWASASTRGRPGLIGYHPLLLEAYVALYVGGYKGQTKKEFAFLASLMGVTGGGGGHNIPRSWEESLPKWCVTEAIFCGHGIPGSHKLGAKEWLNSTNAAVILGLLPWCNSCKITFHSCLVGAGFRGTNFMRRVVNTTGCTVKAATKSFYAAWAGIFWIYFSDPGWRVLAP